MKSRTRSQRSAALLAVTALAVTACGGDEETTTTGGDETVAADGAETSEAPADGASTDAETSEAPADAAASGDVDDCGIENSLIEAAKEEGEVIYFAPTADNILQDTAGRFEDRYGISVSANRQPTGDLIQQVDTSLEAGTVPADVVSLAEPSGFITWTDEGVLREFDIPNEDDIVEGLKDPDRLSYPTTVLILGAMYSTANQDEASLPTTWEGFAEQVGDHRVAIASPASSGTGLASWWGIESITAPDFYSAVADTMVTDSALTLNQLVLTGEADFAVPGIESEIIRAQGTGEPLAVIYPEDGVVTVLGEIGLLADSPNPNAGELFAQWMMCPVQQDITHENGYRPSLADSPSPEGVPPIGDLNLIPVNVADVVERRAELIEAFDASTS